MISSIIRLLPNLTGFRMKNNYFIFLFGFLTYFYKSKENDDRQNKITSYR